MSDNRSFNALMNEVREAAVGIAFNSFAYYAPDAHGNEMAKIDEAVKALTKALRAIHKMDD